MLQVKKYCLLIKDKQQFTYSRLGKAFEKQTKSIEEQGKNQTKTLEEHEKQLIKFW